MGAGRDLEGVRRCVLDAVHKAQGYGCAPGILGVCVGGDRACGFEEAKHQLETLAATLEGYTVHTELLFGTPGPEIVRYTKKEKFDLIMMTRSSRGPLQKLGSVASYIAKKAPDCDILIMREVHTPEGAETEE